MYIEKIKMNIYIYIKPYIYHIYYITYIYNHIYVTYIYR